MTPRDLRPLLAPRSIALIGASPANAYATRLLDNLVGGGFTGPLYLVNPRQERLGDRRCYPSVEALPEAVDLAAVVVPHRAVLPVLESCGRKGIAAALVISAGFAEAGAEGRVAEDAVREVAARYGLLVCGPNCLGFANVVADAMVHAYTRQPVRAGNIALVSQSGAMAFACILSPASDRRIGFSHVVSSGNEAVLDSVDYIRHFASDPATRVITSLLEGFKPGRGRAFLEVADEAWEAGKPIIVCKVGRSELGARQVISHTGSMTGSDVVYDAAFAQKGVIRVPDPDDLFEVASLFSRCPEPKGDGLAILSTSGGLGVLLADKCGAHGLELPPLGPTISRTLAESGFLLVLGDLGNPVDIRGQGSEHLPELLRPFIADDRYHVITLAFGLPAVGERSARIARDIVKVAAETAKPLIVLWTGTKLDAEGRFSEEDGFRILETAGIPIFYSPEKYFRALHAFVTYHRGRRQRSKRRPTVLAEVDAASARSFLDGKEGVLDEVDSRKLLSLYGLPMPRERLASDVETAVAAARAIGFPVVLKAVSSELAHKTEVGAVRVNLGDEAALRRAWDEIASAVTKHGACLRGMLVQEMVRGREMIVGSAADPQFGPVVSCGVGGVVVELLRDVARRLPPLAEDDVREMITSLAAAPLLRGFRGRRPADVASVVDVVRRIGRLALDLEDRVAEVEINPLIVREEGGGSVTVDALVVLRPLAGGTS